MSKNGSVLPNAPTGLGFDWNRSTGNAREFVPRVVDETLRDGLQSPSVQDPPLDQKVALVHLMAALGVDCVALGYPAAHHRQWADVLALADEIARSRLPIQACCAARALPSDIAPIADLVQRSGVPIQVGLFVASSPIRQLVETWDLDQLLELTKRAVSFAVQQGLEVMYVAEDSTRAAPEVLAALYKAAVEHGATRVCIADTAGHATPAGTGAIVGFVRSILDHVAPGVQIDWHGHRDRGLDLANALTAWDSGAERCHGTALGIGERCGNTPLELLLLSSVLDGRRNHDLTLLPRYAETAAAALGVTIPPNHPVVGRDAFRTSTGTHAAALVKASLNGDLLSASVDGGVPPALVGRRSIVEIGPLSGTWNVRGWLRARGFAEDPALVRAILEAAKKGDRVLEEAEILRLIRRQPLRASGGQN